MNELLIILMVALCSASISFTITTTSMFTWFRESVSNLNIHKLEELVFCPWCFSHYVTLVILLSANISYINIVNSESKIANFYNFCFTWFAIQCIVGIFHYILLRAYEPVAKQMANRKIMKAMRKEADLSNE